MHIPYNVWICIKCFTYNIKLTDIKMPIRKVSGTSLSSRGVSIIAMRTGVLYVVVTS